MLDSRARILLTGSTGQVGGDLLRRLPAGSLIAPGRSDLDLRDPESIKTLIRKVKPDWIINPAAYTAVDKAEGEPELAYAINADAPRAMGEAAAELGIPVIHFSTDYVFDGSGTRPWVEDDLTGPLGVYGASKLAGERALAQSGAVHLIFRTSWVYSSRGKNFLRTILHLAQERPELCIVNDQHGTPTWSRDLAELVVHVMKKIVERGTLNGVSVEDTVRAVQGVYHSSDSGETTWFGFATEFLRLTAAARPAMRLARLVPIESSEYPTPAKRPSNSRLDCSRLRAVFGLTMPAWEESTASVIAEILSGDSVTVSSL
jgi:dTDP-4-dehydrorhamnose reductase